MEEGSNISSALINFSKKLEKFSKADEKNRRLNLNRLNKKNGNAALSQKRLKESILESEEERRTAVLNAYRAFKFPSSKAVEEDENALSKAYEMFKAVLDLNRGAEKETVEFRHIEMYAPFCDKEFYTSVAGAGTGSGNGKFIYLAAWFRFEKKITDYVPVMKCRNSGSSFYLDFEEAETHLFSPEEKEVLSIIEKEFYCS